MLPISSGFGFAVPMSSPRYTCIESIVRISAPVACRSASRMRSATSTAKADFPLAVAPTITGNRVSITPRLESRFLPRIRNRGDVQGAVSWQSR